MNASFLLCSPQGNPGLLLDIHGTVVVDEHSELFSLLVCRISAHRDMLTLGVYDVCRPCTRSVGTCGDVLVLRDSISWNSVGIGEYESFPPPAFVHWSLITRGSVGETSSTSC